MFKIDKKELKDLSFRSKKILKIANVEENPAVNWYKYKSPTIQARNYFIISFCKILPPCEFKNSIYRSIGVKIGKDVSIVNDCLLDPMFPELIVIKDDAIIGWGAKLYTHEFTQKNYRIGSIIVDENVTIGELAVVRPGITIGKGALIGAMSFVNKDVKSGDIVAGIPIRSIKNKLSHPKK